MVVTETFPVALEKFVCLIQGPTQIRGQLSSLCVQLHSGHSCLVHSATRGEVTRTQQTPLLTLPWADLSDGIQSPALNMHITMSVTFPLFRHVAIRPFRTTCSKWHWWDCQRLHSLPLLLMQLGMQYGLTVHVPGESPTAMEKLPLNSVWRLAHLSWEVNSQPNCPINAK